MRSFLKVSRSIVALVVLMRFGTRGAGWLGVVFTGTTSLWALAAAGWGVPIAVTAIVPFTSVSIASRVTDVFGDPAERAVALLGLLVVVPHAVILSVFVFLRLLDRWERRSQGAP